jgi:hypothetical protein
MLLERAESDQLDKHFSRAEKLTEEQDPTRAFSLGWIMNRMGNPKRSIPLLQGFGPDCVSERDDIPARYGAD